MALLSGIARVAQFLIYDPCAQSALAGAPLFNNFEMVLSPVFAEPIDGARNFVLAEKAGLAQLFRDLVMDSMITEAKDFLFKR